LINSGYQKGSKVARLEESGVKGKMKLVWYCSFAPKVFITTFMELPHDTVSRCIEIMIQRASTIDAPNYEERWSKKDRELKLKKIREMAFLFRLKYGSEVARLGSENWKETLDISNAFSGLRNRDQEIFGPLAILCLKFKPLWKDDLAKYISKNIEMKTQLDPTPVNNVLWALRDMYQELTANKRIFVGEDNAMALISDDKGEKGPEMFVAIAAIETKINSMSDMINLGRNPKSSIGKVLKDLGFTVSVRRQFQSMTCMCRVIGVDQLQDRCMRYLGRGLGDSTQDSALSQHEKANIVKDVLLNHEKTGIKIEHLIADCSGKVPEKEVRGFLKDLKEQGYIIVKGDGVIQWIV
jgi:hypothetical protein